ncbi:ABC transporter permease [Bacillus cereus group sp. TH43LC]|uniref:ABC transporter permease n=1 Tax=Bacillus TaxID=1386 RepID=UPI00016B9450|nr:MULTISPECIES: ABC transporter permease [Bacillus]EDZ59565.1 putative ABC transporter, permease protein [Bacillus cereus H3081.97]EJQ06888.1 DrrB family ABC transporter efflux protein [Bacillus cereus AND1407]KFL82614.1 ABC-2 type transporter family protein [Bacillus cereus]MRA59029.1 ABC transporter permease subunit [Bacillus thuringiensis]OUA69544.1 ABC transporter permease [Bacillus thuringiensis serovar thailandensis]OUB94252.1 ABC transporter permease [Bacillus thuringiensis serovar ca
MRVTGVIIRIIRQFFRDKRSLAMMFGAPMLLLWLLSLVFTQKDYVPHIAVVDMPAQLVKVMKNQEASIYEYNIEKAMSELENQKVDAVIRLENGKMNIVLEGSDSSKNRAVLQILQKSTEKNDISIMKPEVNYLHGSKNFTMFDGLGPVLIGFFTFFFVFILSGVSFVRERLSGTLERLLSTPIKRWEIVVGYIIGFGIFAFIQSIIIVSFSVYILDLYVAGSIWLTLLITCMLSLTALTLGTFLSAYANNEFQMIQFIPLVIVPQIFFSGLFPIESMNKWLQMLGKLFPLTYGADAMRQVMIRNQGFTEIALDLTVLLLFSILFAVGNVFALKKHRKI